MKKSVIAGVLVVYATVAGVANADAGGAYAGFGFGDASSEGIVANTTMSWKVFGGYAVNSKIAVEGGYTYFGESYVVRTNGFSAYVDYVQLTAFELAAIITYPASEQFSLFGKLGVASIGSDSTREKDITFGAGGTYRLAENLSMRASWERYQISEGNIDLLSAGIVLRF